MRDQGPIDFVIIWVDGADPAWRREYMKYKGMQGDQRGVRFRDMGLLRYWFRSVEQCAPWVNKIYFVTCGQTPEWLNTDHPKLVCIKHDEFIPKQYLPTFSSHTIELNLHRIPGLSERFVYFNDDMFLICRTAAEDFFRHGEPCDSAVMDCMYPTEFPMMLCPLVSACIMNRHFRKADVLLRNFNKYFTLKNGKYLIKTLQFCPGKYFSGFKTWHLPASFLKSSFSELWEAESEILDKTCGHKFRMLSDVSQSVVQDWQRCMGRFHPRRYTIGKAYYLTSGEQVDAAASSIGKSRYKMICLNDDERCDFGVVSEKLQEAFLRRFSEKSLFELNDIAV